MLNSHRSLSITLGTSWGSKLFVDDLYLDKAFNNLQHMTAPSEEDEVARPAYRMFEGRPHFMNGGMEWEAWRRVILPSEVSTIADDLNQLTEADFMPHFTRFKDDSEESRASECDYVMNYLAEAKIFVGHVEAMGRGFVYSIA